MAIQGSLRSIPIPDLFAILLQQRKTGVLTLVSEEKERSFLFCDGNLLYATTQDKSKRLGSFLVRLGFLKEEELELVFGSSFGKGAYLGQRIVDHGRVTPEQLGKAVKAQIVDLLDEVMSWEHGAFHFDDTPLPFDVPKKDRISTQRVILDVARRRDENQSEESLTDKHAVFRLESETDPESLSAEHREVLSLIDGRKTVEQIAFKSSLEPPETAKVLDELAAAGIVVECLAGAKSSPDSSIPEITNLPIAPETASKIFSMFNFDDEEHQVLKVREVLSQEPLLTAKLLKMLTLSNVEVCRADLNIQRLVDLLGMFYIRSSLLPEATRGFFFPQENWFWRDLWDHSHACALLCRKMAKKTGYSYPEEAFLAGLLHNLGAFILLHHSPRRYKQVISVSMRNKQDIEEVEEEQFGISHTTLGGKYAEEWSFPLILSVVIKNHHGMKANLQSPLLHLVAVANALLQDRGAKIGYQTKAAEDLDHCLTRIHMDSREALALCRETMREMEGDQPSSGTGSVRVATRRVLA